MERIRATGVDIRCGVRLGEDLPWRDLDAYAAVFLATGAHASRRLGLEGEDLEGISSGLAYLRQVNQGAPPALGRRVIVLGGGNTAMDCARTARRHGAEVQVLYRRTRAEMPAIEEEVADAEREGVTLTFLTAPTALITEGGRITGLECVRMRLGEPDASGRRRPVPEPGTTFQVAADHILTAIGESIDTGGLPEGIPLMEGAIQVSPLGEASTRFFAGGDLTAEPRTVAHALGAGKRAAIGIDMFLRRQDTADAAAGNGGDEALRFGPHGNVSISRWRDDDPVTRHGAVNEVVRFEQLNMDHFQPRPRQRTPRLEPEACRTGFDEVLPGLTAEAALAEAGRCFNCGVCNQCELCLIFCPDLAITARADGSGFAIDYDYCKGCGVCHAECPRGAMHMTREGL